MTFISYLDLNTDFDPSDMAEIAQEFISKKLQNFNSNTSISSFNYD